MTQYGARRLAARIQRQIEQPSARDKQRNVGPSDIGDPCDRCLGLKMAGKAKDGPRAPDGPFSMAAWVGTCVHYFMERKFRLKKVQHELSLKVFYLKGYGWIKGHIDVYSENDETVLDYKTSKALTIKGYRAKNSIPEKHDRQTALYCYAVRRAGLPVEWKMLYYIPRDSNNLHDCWAYIAWYDEALALDTIKRAKKIWKRVQKGEVEMLTSHPECYVCNRYSRDLEFV